MERKAADFEGKLKDLLALAKAKKSVLYYQEITDFFKDAPLSEE